MEEDFELTEEQLDKFDKLGECYNDYFTDRFIEHIEEDEYFQKNFSDFSGKKFSNMINFLIRLHQHGIFVGMLINEVGEVDSHKKTTMKFIPKNKIKNKK